MTNVEQYIYDKVVDVIQQLEPIFKDDCMISVIVRTPGNDEADILVTAERDLNELIKLLQRRQTGE